MAEELFMMKVEKVPYSSVVGSGLTIVDKKLGVVAQLAIMVPQPRFDYKLIADAVAKALLTHGTCEGNITLVLPRDFAMGTNPK